MGIDSYELEEDLSQGPQKLDLSRYVAALKRRWWLAALITLVIAVPWTIYVKKELPVYEATASIRFRNLSGNAETLLEDIYEQITSRTFTEQVVSDLGLVMNVQQDGSSQGFLSRRQIFERFISSEDPVPGRYALRFPGQGRFTLSLIDEADDTERTIHSGEVVRATLDTVAVNGFSFQLADMYSFPPQVTFTISPFRHAVKSLQDRIAVDLNRSWTLMFVTLRDNDPYIVTQTVNSLASIFIKKSFDVGKKTQGSQLEMLKAQADRARRDYEEIDRRLTDAKRRAGVTGGTGFQLTFERHRTALGELQVLTDLQESLAELLGRLNATGEEGNAKSREARRYIYTAIANSKVFDNNPTMAITRQRLEDLEAEWSKQASLKTENHPDVIKLQSQIDQLYFQVQEVATARLATLRREVSRKQQEVSRLAVQIEQMPAQESDLAELQREWDQKSTYYQHLQAQVQQLEISSVAENPSIEILDPAIEPQFPINRNKAARAAAGGVVGLLLGLGVVFGIELLDRSIKTVDDARSSLHLHVLGAIPQIDFGEYYEFQDNEKAKMVDQQLVTHDYSPTPIGEAYRSLRTNILFSKVAGRVQTLVITSTAPGDGKSFTAANLSITMAQQKSNTLLVDTDLRRGVLHNTFGVPKEPGFSNYLTGSILASEVINETHIPNLSMISCGSLIPNPSEMLGSVQLRRFLDEMRRRFDLIVFDTPPLNAATDAVVLGTQVDGVVVVVRAGKTRKDVARQKIELFQNVHAKILGVILNGTAVDLAHEGYSYYHY